MITTVDGIKKKRGEIVYEIAFYHKYIPLKSIVHKPIKIHGTTGEVEC